MTEQNPAGRNAHSGVETFLHAFFTRELNRADADFSREPLSYDGQSDYDHLCYGLVKEAERLCRLRFGFAPTGCQLQRALAVSEFHRLREKRRQPRGLWQSLLQRLRGK